MKELCLILIYHQNEQDIFKALLSGLGKWERFQPLYILLIFVLIMVNSNFPITIFQVPFKTLVLDVLYFNDEERTQY